MHFRPPGAASKQHDLMHDRDVDPLNGPRDLPSYSSLHTLMLEAQKGKKSPTEETLGSDGPLLQEIDSGKTSKDGMVIQYVTKELLQDREVVGTAVVQNPHALQLVELIDSRGNQELILSILPRNVDVLKAAFPDIVGE